MLLLRDIIQPSHNVLWLDAPEGKALAARQNGRRHLVQLRRRQNEHQMLGRLLQYLQQRVERGRGEHMHLVHDIHAPLHLCGRIDRLVAQRAHAVHAVVGRRVQLHHIQQPPALDAKATRAAVARVAVHRMLAVDRARKDLCAGRLACAARTGKQVSVRQPSLRHLPPQRGGDMLLPHHIGKGARPPLAVKRLIHPAALLYKDIKSLLRIQLRDRRPCGTWLVPLNAARFPA